ncbi:SWIB-domain-containing protein [Paenibacillus popilliae ATCC 14706]|uniref:SWIB-domain-containing protein n=2 Tax=Paenibacillus popilliae TaxID=78057 RepID=M9LN87_PAEPP|nr:SWIB-domain-containing protein [Paenibacillus popilliae ATCC 14706]
MFFSLAFKHGYAGSIITYTLLLINHFIANDSIYSLFRYISINQLYIDVERSGTGNLSIFDAYTLLALLSLASVAAGFYLCNRTDFLQKEHTRW